MSNIKNSICNEISSSPRVKDKLVKNLDAKELFENILDSYEIFRKDYQLVFKSLKKELEKEIDIIKNNNSDLKEKDLNKKINFFIDQIMHHNLFSFLNKNKMTISGNNLYNEFKDLYEKWNEINYNQYQNCLKLLTFIKNEYKNLNTTKQYYQKEWLELFSISKHFHEWLENEDCLSLTGQSINNYHYWEKYKIFMLTYSCINKFAIIYFSLSSKKIKEINNSPNKPWEKVFEYEKFVKKESIDFRSFNKEFMNNEQQNSLEIDLFVFCKKIINSEYWKEFIVELRNQSEHQILNFEEVGKNLNNGIILNLYIFLELIKYCVNSYQLSS